MTEIDIKSLRELLRDAETCARLSDWENEFVSDMQGKLLTYGEDVRVTEKQQAVLRRIEAKIYQI